MRALISVSDKRGIIDFAQQLQQLGVEIISTGGTAKQLKDAGVNVIGISDVTGFPECLDGRVKTLHPNIHAGLLAIRSNKEHMNQLKELNIDPIDIVVVNLYPFKETILKENVTQEEAIENIDIGGPTMLRSAAKNYQDVAVVVDPVDYKLIIEDLTNHKNISLENKLYLCKKVFEHTAHYDTLISHYLQKQLNDKTFPETITLTYEKVQDMRYGENPHQKAAFYKEVGLTKGALTNAEQLHGKELSFNNINDTNGALELLKEFSVPTIVACKHANPCGVGSAETIFEAYTKAYQADPVSIFGGIVVSNRTIDKQTAEEVNKIFIEIIVAPEFTEEAINVLTQKKNIRILKLEDILIKQADDSLDLKKVSGGLLVQTIDNVLLPEVELEVVTDRAPTKEEMKDLLFTWKVVKFAKSNGIAIGKDLQTLGVGPGQVNRIWACNQAIDHAREHLGEDALIGAALASDAFFPFSDCVEAANKAGIKCIIQPGGSIRDKDSIEACNKYGIAMVFTKMRHFKH